MYYDIETWVVVNQSVNLFHTRFLFKIDALPQDVALPLDIAANFFNNLSPNVREFLVLEWIQVPPRLPTEKNHQGKQSLLWFINTTVESEKKTRTIKLAVQPASRIHHTSKFVGMLGGNSSTQMAVLGSSFQSK